MAITLGSVVLSDAEVTDGIGIGDVAAAARLWVRYWPTALSAARMYVESDEVPGLAAEALIGTIAAISVGRGPREDLNAFVTAAVTELGESDEPAPSLTAPAPPEVFVSPMMTRAFAGLSGEDQEILWLTIAGEQADQLIAEALNVQTAMAAEARLGALTALQRDYLAEHTERATDPACHQAHGAMAAAVSRGKSLGGGTWVHMSECAWCTEAFHELAFSNVAINALVDRATLEPVVPVVVPPVVEPAEPTAVEPAAALVEPLLEELPPVPYEPDLEPAASSGRSAVLAPLGGLRGRRTRIAAGALVAAAAITAGVLVLTSLDGSDDTLNTAGAGQAQAEPTDEPESFVSVAPPLVDDLPTPPTSPATSPTATPTAARVVAPPTQAASTPRPTTAAPTPKPSATPTPTPEPSPTAPTASPTPTPTGPRCNALAHLLGFC